jgi:intein-encoded DNA endonuclease-like protein
MPIQKSVNQNFFKKWDRDMAYILGFTFADGTITINKNGSRYYVLQISDEDLLERIKQTLGSEHKISKRVHKKDGSVFYRLQIGNAEIVRDLSKLGVVPGKTARMALPSIPAKYLGDFTRGYFDGDGNVWVGMVHKERATKTEVIQTVFTSCSQVFLAELQIRLELLGITGSLHQKKQGTYSRLQYSVKSSILLFRLMYESTTNGLFLNRKRCVFERFLNK